MASKKKAKPQVESLGVNGMEKFAKDADGLWYRMQEDSCATHFDADDSSLVTEDVREEGFKDGMHSASCLVDEVLQAVRVDIENADLDPIASTAAKMTVEAIARLWYERKGVV